MPYTCVLSHIQMITHAMCVCCIHTGAASAAVSLHATGSTDKYDPTGPERILEGAIDDFADLCRCVAH